ncbi:hypothetical protein BC628DRAFT_85971 [Trametes gibbosa]|nr:hypothetical protein BC628DRAFT_85971 [Trametes gibbosa]
MSEEILLRRYCVNGWGRAHDTAAIQSLVVMHWGWGSELLNTADALMTWGACDMRRAHAVYLYTPNVPLGPPVACQEPRGLLFTQVATHSWSSLEGTWESAWSSRRHGGASSDLHLHATRECRKAEGAWRIGKQTAAQVRERRDDKQEHVAK